MPLSEGTVVTQAQMLQIICQLSEGDRQLKNITTTTKATIVATLGFVLQECEATAMKAVKARLTAAVSPSSSSSATGVAQDSGSPLVDVAGGGSSNGEAEVDGSKDSTLAANKKTRLCKSRWIGKKCEKADCQKAHPPFCADAACKERRLPNCKLWHHVGKSKKTKTAVRAKRMSPKSVGNGSRGNGPSSVNTKGNSNNYSGLKHKLEVAENQRLRAELALLKAKRSNPALSGRSYASVVSSPVMLPAPAVIPAPKAASKPMPMSPDLAMVLTQMSQMSQQIATLVASLGA